jgi:hypothetical protein
MYYKLVFEKLLNLRRQGHFDEAHQFAINNLIDHPNYHQIVFDNNPIFWREIKTGGGVLTRRNSKDIEFMRILWSNKDFLFKFHRLLPELPVSDNDLSSILDLEYSSVLSESKAIHWIVNDKKFRPWGLVTITEISIPNKRAEVLIGILPNAPPGLSVVTMLIVFEFFFKLMNFNKLISYVYEDNLHALNGALHLGFKIEGKLMSHVLDPKSGNYVNLYALGLFKKDAFNTSNSSLMKRLLTIK